MFKELIASATLGIAALVSTPAMAQTHDGLVNIMVLPDDVDPDSLPMSNNIHYRITHEMREQFRQWGYDILDHDAVLARLKWADMPNRLSRREKISFAQSACSDGDTTTCPELLVFVQARANIQPGRFGSTASVRLQGDVIDVANGTSLGSWQPVRDEFTAPANCNRFCRDEVIGDQARGIAADLGDVLRIKLDNIMSVRRNGWSKNTKAEGDKRTDYLITFRNFKRSESGSIIDLMENDFPGRPKVSVSGPTMALVVNYSSLLGSKELNDYLFKLLLDMNLSEDEFRITAQGREIEVDKFMFGR